jgi:hypothetical protein
MSMMSISLDAVPRKLEVGYHNVTEGTPYPEVLRLVEQMQAQDPRVIFDSLRPVGDEIWNFIDGRRTVREVVESACIEFGFDLDPDLFLPLVEGLARRGLIEIETDGH